MTIKDKRHTDFYIPVLKVLEDMKPHEVNQLIEEVANHCHLSDEDKKVLTKGGSNLKYRSHIQWAVTDLRQGGFIGRDERGVYKMSFDGLLMLEDNPERPTRDYLSKKSEKFRDFVNRKGTRSKDKDIAGLFDEEPENGKQPENAGNEEIPTGQKSLKNEEINLELKSLYDLRDKMTEMGFNTKEIDDKIEKVKSESALNKVVHIIQKTLSNLPPKEELKCVIIIDNAFERKPTAYIEVV